MTQNETKQDTIADALGIEPMPVVQAQKTEITLLEPVEKNPDADADFILAREAIRDALSTGQSALKDILDVAAQSQHPRAYEVTAGLINTITASAKALMELNKTKKDMEPKGSGDNPTTVNNTLVMTTADVLQLLKNQQKQDS